jgi:hypothetical protein
MPLVELINGLGSHLFLHDCFIFIPHLDAKSDFCPLVLLAFKVYFTTKGAR